MIAAIIAPDTTRKHSISFDIISPEIQKRFALIGKDEYLFKREELPIENFLPLIKTADGRYAGKMLRYAEEESNTYFGTGRTGSGKSWAISQIIVMLFMLGQLVVVFDVSGSYTKETITLANSHSDTIPFVDYKKSIAITAHCTGENQLFAAHFTRIITILQHCWTPVVLSDIMESQ